MTRNNKIKIIAEYLTNDEEEIKRVSQDIEKNWFDVNIDMAIYNLLDNEGRGAI